MNILHISSAATWRGGERQVYLLMKGLKNNGHANFLMSPKVSILRFRSTTVVTSGIAFRKGILSLVPNVIALLSFCRSNKIDIIHGHDSHAHTLLWMAYKFGGLKPKSLITRRLLNSIKNRSKGKYNYPKIERIICISNAVKKTLLPSIIYPKRLIVIHSAIEVLSVMDSQKSAIENSDFVVGYVAAFTEEKDHATFLKVAENLVEKYHNINFTFLLVGDGPLLEKYKTESKRINGAFKFTGFVEEVNQAYLKMDLLLHTSKSEALGTAILDAMKYSLPIVASNIGGIPELVQNGKNGYLCNVGDVEEMANAIYKLATDKEMYDTFSKNSNVLINQFDVKSMVEKTIESYMEIIKSCQCKI